MKQTGSQQAHFEMQWPRDNLYLSGFAHEIMNYRYHWHSSQYELNILLHGSQEFCIGTRTHILEEDDVLLINPGTGHASFAPQANTRALVVHFSTSAFKPFVKKGYTYHFDTCLSSPENRYHPCYNRIRFYAGQIFQAMSENGPYSRLTAKASLELLLATLCTMFEPVTVKNLDEEDMEHQETVKRLIAYIEEHFREKISLEDLARFSQYNRTYVSTLFKQTIGINFYEYLTRVRFQNALLELAATSKNLTEIAIGNGFPDLKSFNARFREILHRTPAQYREQLSPGRVFCASDAGQQSRNYISLDDDFLRKKLGEYLRMMEL